MKLSIHNFRHHAYYYIIVWGMINDLSIVPVTYCYHFSHVNIACHYTIIEAHFETAGMYDDKSPINNVR